MVDMETELALLKQRLGTLERQYGENLKEIKDDLRALTCQYTDLQKLLHETAKQGAAKPSWATTLVITTLTSAVTGLIMWIVTHS